MTPLKLTIYQSGQDNIIFATHYGLTFVTGWGYLWVCIECVWYQQFLKNLMITLQWHCQVPWGWLFNGQHAERCYDDVIAT